MTAGTLNWERNQRTWQLCKIRIKSVVNQMEFGLTNFRFTMTLIPIYQVAITNPPYLWGLASKLTESGLGTSFALVDGPCRTCFWWRLCPAPTAAVEDDFLGEDGHEVAPAAEAEST